MNLFPLVIIIVVLGITATLIKREQENKDFPDNEQGS
jgi:hypothetical protein